MFVMHRCNVLQRRQTWPVAKGNAIEMGGAWSVHSPFGRRAEEFEKAPASALGRPKARSSS